MYKRQKRRRAIKQRGGFIGPWIGPWSARRGIKQQGGFFLPGRFGGSGGIRNLPPFKILRAIKTIHDFCKQKGTKNKIKFAYKKLK